MRPIVPTFHRPDRAYTALPPAPRSGAPGPRAGRGGKGHRHPHRRLAPGAVLATFILLAAPWSALAAEDPVATVDAFHAALTTGDREAALDLLADDLVVFESGWAERSRAEYAAEHLDADMEFSAATTREVLERSSGEAGEAAWVLTETRTAGTFRGRQVSSLGLETMILRREAEGWRIVHIHWSSRQAE